MAMTAATDVGYVHDAKKPRDRLLWTLLITAFLLIAAHALGVLPQWLVRLPESAIPPTAEVIDGIFAFVQNDLGLIHVTRFIAEGPLEFMLDATANLLYGKRRWPNLGPIPWTAIAAHPNWRCLTHLSHCYEIACRECSENYRRRSANRHRSGRSAGGTPRARPGYPARTGKR